MLGLGLALGSLIGGASVFCDVYSLPCTMHPWQGSGQGQDMVCDAICIQPLDRNPTVAKIRACESRNTVGWVTYMVKSTIICCAELDRVKFKRGRMYDSSELCTVLGIVNAKCGSSFRVVLRIVQC